MRIAPVAPSQNISFKRRLTPAEEKEFIETNSQAKKLLGNAGNSVLLIHDACLPQSATRNTGVSNLLNNESGEFFDFAKTYFGINTLEVFPQGEFVRGHKSGLVCAYGYSALGLNDSMIDAESLTTPKWQSILLPSEFKSIVDANSAPDKSTIVNFENINEQGGAFDRAMRSAYNRFMNLEPDEPLQVEFNAYKRQNEDWLTPKSIYHVLKKENGGRDWEHWHGIDAELYRSDSVYSQESRQARINSVLRDNTQEVDFFKFKQFVAEKHLQEGRAQLNKKGLKLFGDMAIKFSQDEIWANPDAFLRGYYVGANDWKAPCFNYRTVGDENSAAHKLLKLRSELAARRYDGTRVDVSWMYVKPKMIEAATGKIERIELGDTALRIIEGAFERVHGEKYSPQSIIHEFKAGADDFSMFKDGVLRPEVAARTTIMESENLHASWGHTDYYFKELGMSADSVIFGVGDHTAQPLRQIAAGMQDMVGGNQVRLYNQAPVLADLFKDSAENLMKPAEFIRTKFADAMCAKHNFFFFMDSLGFMSRFDSQGLNTRENYRYKISPDYKDRYHKAVQRGQALNLPDSLARAFEKTGLATEHADLYNKLLKFAKILKEKDASDVASKIENTSNGLGGKKWALIGATTCVVVGLGVLAYKHFSNKNSNN